MNDSSKVWLPNGLEPSVAMALSVVDPGAEISRSLYLNLLTAKLDAMIQADPAAAQRALEMSQEQALGLWSIAENHPRSEWASALVQSDQMTRLLARWKGGGSLSNPKPQSLLEILELIA